MRSVRALTPRPGRSRRWVRLLWLAVALCLFLLGSALGLLSYFGSRITGGGVIAALRSFASPPFGGRQQVTILVMGVDNIGHGLADTLLVGSIQPFTRRLAVLSIPRDSRVEIPGHGTNRINSAHQFGGAELTKQTVERLLGLPIDYYVEIGVSGLAELVDAIGGVEIEVTHRMRYHDRRGHLSIDLEPGRQHLDGEQAVGFVRFRNDRRGDLGRVERQQLFLRQVARQLFQGENLARLPALARAFVNTVHTNLSVSDLLALKGIARGLEVDTIPMIYLTGEPVRVGGASMLQLDGELTQNLVNQFRFAVEPRVEVLNGTEIEGLASSAAERLRRAGVPVFSTGNTSRYNGNSRVIDHIGRADRAREIARLLSCKRVIRGQPGLNEADITVILGPDSSHLLAEGRGTGRGERRSRLSLPWANSRP